MKPGRWSAAKCAEMEGAAAQWNRSVRAQEHTLDACKALWCAIVASAVEDLASRDARRHSMAVTWLEQSSGEPGSFEWVCEKLDLDATAVRERLFGSDAVALRHMRERISSGARQSGQPSGARQSGQQAAQRRRRDREAGAA